MRIVRFHLEPWQRNNKSLTPSPAPSPSLLIASPLILRRQRLPTTSDVCPNCLDHKMALTNRPERKLLRNRYPMFVKKLSILCSDVIARNVCRNCFVLFSSSIFIFNSNNKIILQRY